VENVAVNKVVLDEAKYPEIMAWADRACAHHAVKDVMPETDRLVESSANSAAAVCYGLQLYCTAE
jgi:glutathione S-transferase